MIRRFTIGPTAVALCAAAVAALSLLPFVYLVAAGFSFGDIRELFGYPTTVPIIVRTIALTVVVAALSIIFGVLAASLVVRTNLPFPALFTVLFAMPLAIPGFVSSYAVYSASLTYLPESRFVTTFAGAALILALSLYPYVFLPCVIALRNADPGQEEVARALGYRGLHAFLRVTISQLRPALAAGVLIVSLHVLAEYGAMVQLGQKTLTTTIMVEIRDYGDYRSARSLAMLLTVISLGALLTNRWFAGRTHRASGASTVRPPNRWKMGPWRPAVVLGALVIPLAAVAPTLLMTTRGLINAGRGPGVAWPTLASAVTNTLTYAVAAAAVATIAALPVSWWVSRRPSLAAQVTERSVWLAHAIPNAILGLALVFLATRLLPDLYKTPALLVIAYVILFLPLAVSNQRVGLQAALVSYDEVAASLGSRPWRTFTRISLPLALPGMLTGALLVALDSSKELTSTLMLLPFGSQTLATGLWSTTNGESLDFVAASPYALLMVLLGSIPVFLIVRRTIRDIA